MKVAFGVDVGGTTVKMGYFDADGTLLDKWEIPTNIANNGEAIIPDIAASMDAKLAAEGVDKADVLGVGIGVPGPVTADGRILNCVNLGWGIFQLEEEVTRQTGFFCKAGNDANVATLGEMYKGGGRGYENLVMLTLGTGVGGGIIVGGKMLPGMQGAAGEVGHIVMFDEEEDTCGCGKHGCLEQYTSANGIARVARKALAESTEETALRQFATVTSKEVFDCAKAGDAFALKLVDDIGRLLGRACAWIATVVDPEVFVIGGGVSRAGSIVTDVIAKHYERYVFKSGAKFVLAELGNDAGMYGSVKLVLDALQ